MANKELGITPKVPLTPTRQAKRSRVKVEGNADNEDRLLAGPSKRSKHRSKRSKHSKKDAGVAGDPIVVADSEEDREIFEEWKGIEMA